MGENKITAGSNNFLIAFFIILFSIAISIGIYYATRVDNEEEFKSFWVAAGDNKNGSNSGRLMWSDDGKLWNESSSSGASFSESGKGVAYGTGIDKNNIWVAAGNNEGGTSTGNLLWSDDGKLWNKSSSSGASFSVSSSDVAYGLTSDGKTGIWVATGDDLPGGTENGNIMWSNDGKIWNKSTGTSFSDSGNKPAYGLSSDGKTGIWVAAGSDILGDNYAALKWSLDGKEWNDSSDTGASFVDGTANGVAYGLSNDNKTSLWVAAGENTLGVNNGNLKWSLDGKEWNDSSATGASFTGLAFDVAYGLTDDKSTGIWVAAGVEDSAAGKFLWSLDGKEWNESTGTNHGVSSISISYGLASDGATGIWVGAGFGNNNYQNLVWSNDGKHWLPSSSKGSSFTLFGSATASNLTNIAFKGTTQSSYLPKIPDVFPDFNK
jgi:hypothetical protein